MVIWNGGETDADHWYGGFDREVDTSSPVEVVDSFQNGVGRGRSHILANYTLPSHKILQTRDSPQESAPLLALAAISAMRD